MVLSTRATCHATRGLAAAAASLAAAVAGCGEPTTSPPSLTPADVTGTYVLASLDGVAPPVPFGEGTTIVADTTRYAADGTWASVTVGGLAGGAPPISSQRFSGTWALDAQARVIRIRYDADRGPPTVSAYEVLARGRMLQFVSPSTSKVWRYNRVP